MTKKVKPAKKAKKPAFSDKYKIPKRTIENWEGGKRNPPEYKRIVEE